MEYNTLAEEAKTTAQQLKNGQSGDGKQSSTAVHGMNFSSSQSSVSAVGTNRPKKRWLLDIHDEVLKLCRSDPARYYLLDSSTSEKEAGCWRGSSQALQDLVLHYIFENIGATNKFYVEFGFDSDLREGGACGSNTFELSRSDWSGLLMDIQHENLSINLHREQVSAQNIIGLFSKYGVPHQPDYVSIDMDSSDLWVLRSVLSDFVKPRVVSVEYNPNFLFSSTLTFPDPSWGSPALFGNLTSVRDNRHTCFYGASVGAIRLVAQEFGYQLVHRDHHCDLFLIRSDLVEGDDVCPWGEGSFKQASRCSLAEAERVNMNAAPNRKCPEQRHMELEDAVLLVDYQVWSTTFSPALAMQAAWKSIWTEYIGAENGACFKKVYEAYGGRRPIDPIPSWPGCIIHAGLFAFCNKPVMGLDDHPPVAIAFGEIPLVPTRVGTMTLNFHLVGTVVGLRYRIVVQEIHLLTGSVKQQDESMVYTSKVSVELGLYDDMQDKFRFVISAFDAHDELVARKDVSFPLVVTVLPHQEYAKGDSTLSNVSNGLLPPVVAGSATALASVYDTHHEAQGPEDGRDLLAECNYTAQRRASRISGATYSIRPLRAHQGAELCRFYDHGLGNQSRFMFSPLSAGHRDAADIHKCSDIAAEASLRRSICTDADEEGLQTCHDAARAGLRFDLVLMQQGDRERAQHEEDFIYGWAFWGNARQSGDARERYIGIAIADALQGKGFGKKMMRALIDAAEAVTFITTLRLNVRSNNSRAVALYEAFGFQHDDHNHLFLAVDDVVFQKMRLSLPTS
jgi:ribosomal protein S18 acetylase RimI-like enzyme